MVGSHTGGFVMLTNNGHLGFKWETQLEIIESTLSRRESEVPVGQNLTKVPAPWGTDQAISKL